MSPAARGPKPPRKRKANPLRQRGVDTVDWKDVPLLRTFLSDRGKIPYRRAELSPGVTGLTGQQQRQVATAIKNAREMALLPYATSPTAAKKG